MEREDMMLVLLVIVVAIAALQMVQIFGMYGETNQVKALLGPQLQSGLQSGIGSGAMVPQQGYPSQGIGGC